MSPNVLLQGLVPTRELRITNFLRITAAEETQEEEADKDSENVTRKREFFCKNNCFFDMNGSAFVATVYYGLMY